MVFADLALARRLEMMDAVGEVLYCRAHADLYPQAGATFESIAGGIAAFAGVESPLTQAFGLGLAGEVEAEEIDRLEAFFQERGTSINIELCPLADDSLLRILGERGYTVRQFSNVLVFDLENGLGPDGALSPARVGMARTEQSFVWTETVARGFSNGGEVPQSMREVAMTFFHEDNVKHLLVELDGVVAAAGAIAIVDGTGCIFATSTLRDFRGRGAQSALIRASLETAASEGCTLVMAATACGSTSQRNFERQGFKVAFTRSKFFRDA